MSDKNELKVSVIVPVYGVEKYIYRCARSLFEQSMTDGIEFIFVNDCTTDRSIEILKATIEKFPHRKCQIRIINHVINKGLAEARKSGILVARGEYVIHCDSDDWVEHNIYELMYAEAKRTDADIVGCDYYEERPVQQVYKKQNFKLGQPDLISQIFTGVEIESYFWNRMIRRSFYDITRYSIDSDISLFEDMAIVVPMHMDTNKVSYVPQALYHYNRQNIDAMTLNFNWKNVNSAIKVLYSLIPYVKNDIKIFQSFKIMLTKISIALITYPNIYSPQRFMEIDKDLFDIKALSGRGKFSFYLYEKGLYKLNYIIQCIIEKIIKKFI